MRYVPIAVFVLVWALLSGGAWASWAFGLPALYLGFRAKRRLSALPPFTIALTRIPSFVAYFFWRSTYAGWDVALRAVNPTLPLAPEMHTFVFRLSGEVAQLFFAHVINLMPGIISAAVERGSLKLHLLDRHSFAEKEMRGLERQIALLFGEEGYV